MSIRKKSLSCDDIPGIIESSDSVADYDQRHNHDWSSKRKDSGTRSLPRFLKPKYSLMHSMDRDKSVSSEDIIGNVDWRLFQIKKDLATFRQQDIKFRERMGSLSNSIDDIASSSSLTASEISTTSDLVMSNNEDTCEDYFKDDKTLENEIKGISLSFSSEVLNHIPSIAVKCYKTRQGSDPALHETANYINS